MLVMARNPGDSRKVISGTDSSQKGHAVDERAVCTTNHSDPRVPANVVRRQQAGLRAPPRLIPLNEFNGCSEKRVKTRFAELFSHDA